MKGRIASGLDKPEAFETVVSVVGNVTPEGQISSLEAMSKRVGTGAAVVVPAHALPELQLLVDGPVDGD